MTKKSEKPKNLIAYIELLQARGKLTFISDEATTSLKISKVAFHHAARRLIAKNRLFNPVRGFYVIIPIEKKFSGTVDPLWYIDDLMKYEKKNYYVGVLSAASLHGASHQAPQELQVIIGSQLKPIEGKNFRIRFLQKKNLAKTNIEKIKTPMGYVPISSPEETAFDLVRYLRWAGQSNNIVTILQELSSKMDSDKLLKVAQSQKELTLTQRLGFLLDMIGMQKLTKKLNTWLKQQEPSIGLLQPGTKPFKGPKNKKWFLMVNEDLESDL